MVKSIILVIAFSFPILVMYSILMALSPISYGKYYWHYKYGWYPKQVKFEQGMTIYPKQSAGMYLTIPMSKKGEF